MAEHLVKKKLTKQQKNIGYFHDKLERGRYEKNKYNRIFYFFINNMFTNCFIIYC